jgi:hypothetical protein
MNATLPTMYPNSGMMRSSCGALSLNLPLPNPDGPQPNEVWKIGQLSVAIDRKYSKLILKGMSFSLALSLALE